MTLGLAEMGTKYYFLIYLLEVVGLMPNGIGC